MVPQRSVLPCRLRAREPRPLHRRSTSHHDLWRIQYPEVGDIPIYNTNQRAAPMTVPTAPRHGRSSRLVPVFLCLVVPGVLALGACKGPGEGGEGAEAAKAPEAVPVEEIGRASVGEGRG